MSQNPSHETPEPGSPAASDSSDAQDAAVSLGYLSYRSRHRREQDDAAHAELNDSSGAWRVHEHELAASNRPALIDNAERLDAVVGCLREAGQFAYDTEFIGEHTYYPKLCVVQAATITRVELIDPMVCDDLTPFWELIADEDTRVLVHAGLQDLEPVFRHLGRPPRNVIDTQVAAAFAGLGYPLSLKDLLAELLDMDLGKQLKFSQWDRRPLSANQLHYAGEDVRYLPAAWAELSRRIEQRGNMGFVKAAMAELCDASNFTFDPLGRKVKAKGAGSMGRRRRAVLLGLQRWREELAREIDVPPRSLLPDLPMVDLARAMPKSAEEVDAVKGVPRPLKQRYLNDMLGVVATSLEGPLPPKSKRPTRSERDCRDEADALWQQVQAHCEARDISPRVVTSKKELTRVLSANNRDEALANSPLGAGWRRELLGDLIPDSATVTE